MAKAPPVALAAPEFLPLQHPRLTSQPPVGGEWRHEIKFDGYRMQLHVQRSRCTWFSRNGNDWSERFADISGEASGLKDCVVDGEIVALDERGHPDFSRLRSILGKRQRRLITGKLVYVAFDLLKTGKDDIRPEPLRLRKAHLDHLLGRGDFDFLRVADALPGGGAELLKAACQMDLEGIVSKRLDSPYRGGADRPMSWLKSKCRPQAELIICGWRSEGSRLKGVLGGVYREGKLNYVGSVQPGGAKEADGLMMKLRKLEVARSPFQVGKPTRSRDEELHFVAPELVCSVEVAEFTSSGKMRQASWKGLRDDKRPEDVIDEALA